MNFFRKKTSVADGIFKTKRKLGLTLSGGGARGIAHIGAIRAFEQVGIKFDYVTGTSVGSIIGACFCMGKNSHEMEEFVKTLSDRDIIENRFTKIQNSADNIAKVVKNFLGDVEFSALKIPFRCVAVDISTGEEVVLSQGSVAKAVAASSAVPLVFTPIVLGEQVLVDGGLLNNIPADICRQMGADYVVSVDLNHNRDEGCRSLKLIDQFAAAWRIMTSGTAYKGKINSDLIVEPELRIFKRTSLRNIDQMIAEGFRATIAKIERLKSDLLTK